MSGQAGEAPQAEPPNATRLEDATHLGCMAVDLAIEPSPTPSDILDDPRWEAKTPALGLSGAGVAGVGMPEPTGPSCPWSPPPAKGTSARESPWSRPDGRDVSVLMATYHKETAANLERCLASIAGQSEPVGQIVLVVDGPVGDDQEAVIAAFAAATKDEPPLTLVRLERSGGLARALNAGLPRCDGRLTMRMDTDDTCRTDRVAVQTRYFREHPEADLVSSWAREVPDDGSAPAMKTSATEHEHVVASLRWRNVIVHPSVMAKTDRLRGVGGYRADFGMMEDYDLFVRLAQDGARFHVLPRVLVDVATNAAQKKRRGGLGYLRNEIAFRRQLLASGFVGTGEFLLTSLLYAVFRVVSGPLRGQLYKLVRA